MSQRRIRVIVAVAALGLVLALVAAVLLSRRTAVEVAPLEADLRVAREILGKSGRADWAEKAAQDASKRLEWAKKWNAALAGGTSEEREKAWSEWRRWDDASQESLPRAKEELRLMSGDRW